MAKNSSRPHSSDSISRPRPAQHQPRKPLPSSPRYTPGHPRKPTLSTIVPARLTNILQKSIAWLGRLRARYPKQLLGGLIIVIFLIAMSASYQLGYRNSTHTASSNQVVTAPTSTTRDFAPMGGPPTNPIDNSGFLRLSGNVTAVTTTTITIRLQSGATVTLSTPKKMKYFGSGKQAKPIVELPKDSFVQVIGNVTADGFFAASNVRVVPKPPQSARPAR